jgi:putative oxidoreductase
MVTGVFSICIALLAVRLLAGILFFFQGFDKVFRLKTTGVLNAFSDVIARKNIPLSFARSAVFLSSLIELVCGFLLVFGIFRDPALYLLTANMLCVAAVFSMLKPCGT